MKQRSMSIYKKYSILTVVLVLLMSIAFIACNKESIPANSLVLRSDATDNTINQQMTNSISFYDQIRNGKFPQKSTQSENVFDELYRDKFISALQHHNYQLASYLILQHLKSAYEPDENAHEENLAVLDMYATLCGCLALSGETEQAVQLAEEAYKVTPEEYKIVYLCSLLVLYLNNDNIDKAKILLEKFNMEALENSILESCICYGYHATLQFIIGDFRKAFASLEQVKRLLDQMEDKNSDEYNGFNWLYMTGKAFYDYPDNGKRAVFRKKNSIVIAPSEDDPRRIDYNFWFFCDYIYSPYQLPPDIYPPPPDLPSSENVDPDDHTQSLQQ